MADTKTTATNDESWEQKFHQMQDEYKQIQEKLTHTEHALSLAHALAANQNEAAKQTKQHPDSFWIVVKERINNDQDFIKSLVKSGELGLDDQDKYGNTLLMIASWMGCYEIAQFCLNSGASTTPVDIRNQTALDCARLCGFYDIEQLLLFHELNVNVGNDIRNYADTIERQRGINENIRKALHEIGEHSQQMVEDALCEVMVRNLTQKRCFSDTMLNLCWDIVVDRHQDPMNSDLWASMVTACKDVIAQSDPKLWFWFQNFVLPSKIWFRNSGNNDSPKYLYYQLLQWVNQESSNQLEHLAEDLNQVAVRTPDAWQQLLTWTLPLNDLDMGHIRQDRIPNSLRSKYEWSDLSTTSSAAFSSPKFYDYNQYLPQLVLLAHLVDDEFQRSVQLIFKDISTNGEQFQYSRGPVKKIERARQKAQSDYANEKYPTTACVVDFNRCSLTFDNVQDMLDAMHLFVNKVRHFQSGNIISIVRTKNGFVEYAKETQYADIKLNVVVNGGKVGNIIGEVQFLLREMQHFKKQAHRLYSVQRRQETMDGAVQQILPLLLNQEHSLFVAACRGTVKELCTLLAVSNYPIDNLMAIDPRNLQNIFHTICMVGHLNLFLYLRSLMDVDAFVAGVFSNNNAYCNPLEYTIEYCKLELVQHWIQMPEIRQKYDTDKMQLYRLIYHTFSQCANESVVKCITSKLNISNQTVTDMLDFECPMPPPPQQVRKTRVWYHRRTIVISCVRNLTIDGVKRLVSVIGLDRFGKELIVSNWNGINGIEQAIKDNKRKILEYMVLSLPDLTGKYLLVDAALFRFLIFAFALNGNMDTIEWLLMSYGHNVDNERVAKVLCYKHAANPKPAAPFQDEMYHEFDKLTVLTEIVKRDRVEPLKKLVSMVDEKVFVECAFVKDASGKNVMDYAKEQKDDEMLQYLSTFEQLQTTLQ